MGGEGALRLLHLGREKIDQKLPIFRVAEQLDACYAAARFNGHRVQHPCQPSAKPIDGGGLEQVRPILHFAQQAGGLAIRCPSFGQSDGQIEFCDRQWDRLHRHLQVFRRRKSGGLRIDGQHYLDQGVPAHRPLGVQIFDKAFEGYVRGREGVERHLSDPGEEILEPRIP